VCDLLDYDELTQKSAFTNSRLLETEYRFTVPQRLRNHSVRRLMCRFILFVLYTRMCCSYMLRMIELWHVFTLMLLIGNTFICKHFRIFSTFNPFLLLFTIVMPCVFLFQSAYGRRQEALSLLAEIRSHCMHLHMQVKLKSSKSASHAQAQECIEDLLRKLYCSIQAYVSTRSEDAKRQTLRAVLFQLYRLKEFLEPITGSESNMLVQGTINAWAKLRNIADYHTPLCVRIFAQFSLVLMAFSFAPYTAQIMYESNSIAAQVVGIVLCVALQSTVQLLIAVHDVMENPFAPPKCEELDSINTDYMTCDVQQPVLPHPL